MNFKWDSQKNQSLLVERGVCFEDVVSAIHEGRVLDIIKHPSQTNYPNQSLYILELMGYVCMVPFLKDGDEIFLKTIIPSRKMHKIYKKDAP
jgi:uncharacterized DUF497 family protein